MAKKSIVEPIIHVEGKDHILENLDNSEMPILTSVGYARVGENSKTYVSYVIKTQGDKVISMEVGEPNLRAIALDEAKISFVNELMDSEED